jgi:protein-disulfide isomerase
MPSRLSLPVGDRDHVQGRSDAPLTLLEYGDYQCPHCGRAHAVVKALQKHFGAGLRLVYRHFPLEQHRHAEPAAEAAEAAGAQGKFWEMHDLLFTHQDALDRGSLRAHAQALGLDVARWERDLEERAFAARIQQDTLSGIESGALGTPTFYINGFRHDGSADEATLIDLISQLLREHRLTPR